VAKFLMYFLIILFIFLVGVVIADSNRFVIRKITVKTSKISDNHTFLFLSDLHCKQYGKNNKRLFKVLDSIEAEGCFLAGDMITALPEKDILPGIEVVKKLKEKMPVFYSYGNHEYRLKIYENKYGNMYQDLIKELSAINISIMDNEKLTFGDIDIYGLTIGKEYYKRFESNNMPEGKIQEYIGKIDSDRFSILLAHNPEYFKNYVSAGADLILSGHYHGGVVRIPGIGGVISPTFKLFPKYDGGVFFEEEHTMVVNRGLGAHTIPFRFCNPAEIIVIDIKKD